MVLGRVPWAVARLAQKQSWKTTMNVRGLLKSHRSWEDGVGLWRESLHETLCTTLSASAQNLSMHQKDR
jgi:hypothetical protein